MRKQPVPCARSHIHRRNIGARNDQIAIAEFVGAIVDAAPLCVAAAEPTFVVPLAVPEPEDGLFLLMLLLETLLPLTLPDGGIAAEAVKPDTATACVGFHLDALSPASDSDSDSDADSDADPGPDPDLDPDPMLPRPLRIAPATPVTESVPTC